MSKANESEAAAASTAGTGASGAGASSRPAADGLPNKVWLLFTVVALLCMGADQATKIWARDTLPVHPAGCEVPEAMAARQCVGLAVSVIEDHWDWRLSMNHGSAFGLFSSQGGARIFLSVIGVLAVFGMLWMMKKSRADQRILHWALALVAGGAVGNLIDRIYFGVVTDFVLWRYHTKEWPVFNIADVVLVVGVGLMFIDMAREGRREKLLRTTPVA
jgi:signal peptidase II